LDIEENYARGGFNRHLAPGEAPALIVVDFLEAYLRPGALLYAACEPALAAAVVLLQAARTAGIPVLHTRVRYQRGYEICRIAEDLGFSRGPGEGWNYSNAIAGFKS